MARRAAIILAGGQAKRFQLKQEQWKDKALAKLFGKPLLIHVIERVGDVVEEIIVCVNEESRKPQYYEALHQYSIKNVKLCIDEKIAHVEGPIVAIATGLKSASADYCIVLPCDVPLVQQAVVDYLFNTVKGSCVATPMWPDGRIESLIMACERPIVVQITDTLCKLGRRRPDDIIRGVPKVTFVSPVGDLKDLDPEFKSFVNINFREDLTRLPTRVVEKGPIKKNLQLNVGCPCTLELKRLKEASEYNRGGKFQEASSMFSSLSTRLESRGLNFWAGLTRENEGRSLFSLSDRQSYTNLKQDYYIMGKVASIRAAQNYELEAEIYEKNQIGFLAKRARADETWCQLRSNQQQARGPG